jgi:hypothetical protein
MENNELIKRLQEKAKVASEKAQMYKIMNEQMKVKEEQRTNTLAMFFVALIFGGIIYLLIR